MSINVQEVVERLIGPTNPVGCSTTDATRLANLRAMITLTLGLVDELQSAARLNLPSREHSVQAVGKAADDAITSIRESIAGEPQCGGPKEACLVPGCTECGTPAMTGALTSIGKERQRQQQVERWTPEDDDGYVSGELALAAACYAERSLAHDNLSSAEQSRLQVPSMWPWHVLWWKPTNRRRDLVKAGALILAEIERLDRMEAMTPAREHA